MGQWPSSNYLDLCQSQSNIAQTRFSTANFTNEKAFAFTNTMKTSGQKTVKSKEDLQHIPAAILSAQIDNYNSYPDKSVLKGIVLDGSDALGQIWWVQDDKCFYQLVKWGKNPPTDNVWAKTNIKSTLNVGTGDSTDIDINSTNKDNSWVTSVTIKGDGTATYTYDGLHLNKTTSNYTYNKDSSTSTFDVIDRINWNPTDKNPHQISYNVKTISILSQKHHSTSYEWDSNVVNLGAAGIFADGGNGRPDSSLGKNISDIEEDHPWILKTDEAWTPETNTHELSSIITSVELSETGDLNVTYAFPRNWVHGLKTYTGKDYTYIGYAQNGKLSISYLNPASDDNQGPLSAYDYKFIHDHTVDIESRLLPQKEMNLPTGKISSIVKVYTADGSKLLNSYTNNESATSITVEQGSKVIASKIVPSFRNNSLLNAMKIKYIEGDWGNMSVFNDVTSVPNDKHKFTEKTLETQFLKDHGESENWINEYHLEQSVRGIKVYGKDSLTINNGALVRNTTKNIEATVKVTFDINVKYGICKWYGVCSVNPKDYVDKQGNDLTNYINIISTDTTHIKKSDDPNIYCVISDKNLNTTTTQYPYFIYIYPKKCGLIDTISSGSQDASNWFNIKAPISVNIKASTTNFVDNYYLIYNIQTNNLRGVTLTIK